MILTGPGRPLRLFACGLLVLLALLAVLAPAAQAQEKFSNKVPISLPRPGGDEVVIGRVLLNLAPRPAQVASAAQSTLAVRRVGRLPRGYAIAAVSDRPTLRNGKGSMILRFAAVRTAPAPGSGSLNFNIRFGNGSTVFTRARFRAVDLNANTRIQAGFDCPNIGAKARGWRPVARLGSIRLDGERFSARTAVGAAQKAACKRHVAGVSRTAADRFLGAVDTDFVTPGVTTSEGFYATWSKNAEGAGKICVYVRGGIGGGGDVTVNGVTQQFTLDDAKGVARVDSVLPPGEYPFTVRWRQPDGTFRESSSAIRLPAGNISGEGPAEPYASAGPCIA